MELGQSLPAAIQEHSGRRLVGNVPTEVTAFVGRRRELAEAKRRLEIGRLVTLTGVGGVGKTRLALKVASQVHRAFPHGVWLADLAALQEPDLLAAYVADALSMRDQSARSSIEALVDHVQDKHLLLVLDNCEHLPDACARLIAALLRAAPHLRILATSRHLLEVEGEYVLSVPPLQVPSPELSTGDVTRNEAVALFIDRAVAVAPDFRVTESNRHTIAQLCRRLDGIPLAIELAAVRLNAMSAQEVLDRLDDRFQLLTGGWRAGLPHHQTLRAAFDWSFELCDAAEQRMWARLSVFSGGFDLRAAEEVCADEHLPRNKIADTIANLVHKSVLNADSYGTSMRYRLLETTRQYGQQWLSTLGEIATMQRQHCDYYHGITVQLAADWFSSREAEWMSRVRQDLPNLRAALDYCLITATHTTSLTTGTATTASITIAPTETTTTMPKETAPKEIASIETTSMTKAPSMTTAPRAHIALEMATNLALARCWFFIGTLTEGRHWLEQAAAVDAEPSSRRVAAVALAAWIGLCQGDQDATAQLLRESAGLAPEHADDFASAMLSYVQGVHALFVLGEPQAVELLTEARDRFHDVGAAGEAHMARVFLGLASVFLEAPQQAAAAAQDCLASAEAHQADWAISWGIYLVGLAEFRQGNAGEAERLIREALRRQRAMHDRWGPVWDVESLAWVTATTDAQYSARLVGAAASMRRQTGVTISGLRPFLLAHGECEKSVVQRLGKEAYSAAVQQGEGLTFDQAVTLALGGKPAAPPAPIRAGNGLSLLTERERKVAELVSQGLSNREIADQLIVSPRTVETHVQHMFTKLGFTSRSRIATWLTEQRAGRAD